MNLHKKLISDLCRKVDGVKTKGFGTAVDTLMREKGYESGSKGYRRFIPDGFVINSNNSVVTVYECVSTCDISKMKLKIITELWYYLDCEEIALELVVIGKNGEIEYSFGDSDLYRIWLAIHDLEEFDVKRVMHDAWEKSYARYPKGHPSIPDGKSNCSDECVMSCTEHYKNECVSREIKRYQYAIEDHQHRCGRYL